ncbi:MAG TPA: aldose epimerase family protein [Steroidobacteraceae bacterium]|nr:aldose epimerase family protein [Steroidobacteraceae bacterium]
MALGRARRWIAVLVSLPAFSLPALAPAAVEAKRVDFGTLQDGTRVAAAELSNSAGMSVRIIALGAAIQSLSVPDRRGVSEDVVLGHDSPREYVQKPQYFGATVGRYANRIARGKFTLDGREYTLETNDGPNHLHGGVHGLDKVLWKIDDVSSGPPARVVLSHVSPDGAGGYPGTLTITAAYTLNERNELAVEYRARTDRPTIVNITNHSFFNLAAKGDVLGHRLKLSADSYMPVDATLIPTGERRNVAGTPFDFRQPRTIGQSIRVGRDEQLRIGRGYDHNFLIAGEPSPQGLRSAAWLEDPMSGRVLEVLTTAPGVQFYSGNFLDGTVVGKGGRIYRQGDALCLEPQLFPDTPNHPDFPSARLDPGREYVNMMVFRFSVSRP